MKKLGKKKDDEKVDLEASDNRCATPDEMEMEPEVLCLTCGFNCNLVKAESSEDTLSSAVSSFETLRKVLNVKLTKRQVKMWNLEEERFPLCGDCVHQLEILMELTSRITELEHSLKVGKEEFKMKVKTSEEKFKFRQIYDKDDRYYAIRRQLNDDIGLTVTSSRTRSRNVALETPKNQEQNEIQSESYGSREKPENESNFIEETTVPDMNENEDFPDFEDGFSDYSPPSSPVVKTSKRDRKKSDKKATDNEKTEDELKLPEDSGSSKNTPKPRKRKPKDDEIDFIPKSDSDDDLDEVRDQQKMSCITDKATGNVSYLNITYVKIDNELICQTCIPNVAVARSMVRRHTITKHTNLFVCDQCGVHHPSAYSLKMHRSVSHGNSKERQNYRIYCPTCSKPFWKLTKNRMLVHQQSHYNAQERAEAIARGEITERPLEKDNSLNYQCEDCGKAFNKKWSFQIHKASHTESYREICSQCGKSISKHAMKGHLLMHQLEADPTKETNLKKYVCTICDKRFFKSGLLKRHLQAHTGARPWVCHLCYKAFAYKRSLLAHVNAHQNIRKFKCEHCPASFITKSNMQRHEKTYHEEGAKPKRETFIRRPGHFRKYGKNKTIPPKPPAEPIVPVDSLS